MDKPIIQIFESVLFAGGPGIPVLIPVSLHASIDTSYQHKHPDIEFPLVVEKRVLHVLLDNKGPRRTTFLVDHRPYLSQRTYHVDAVASI